ncbi:hypothetical protein ACQUW5_13465 [Legionella sp. CNM-1927-20]|uniref:hypothetical protein n=1 Tax=Legionella sp. CNM-1927-20 TaxID=3422221 RepID=UPI00403AFE49
MLHCNHISYFPLDVLKSIFAQLDNNSLCNLSLANRFFQAETLALRWYKKLLSAINILNKRIDSLNKEAVSYNILLSYKDYFKYERLYSDSQALNVIEQELHKKALLLRADSLKLSVLYRNQLELFDILQQKNLQKQLTNLISALTAIAGSFTEYELSLTKEKLAIIPFNHIRMYFFNYRVIYSLPGDLVIFKVDSIDLKAQEFKRYFRPSLMEENKRNINKVKRHLHPFFKDIDKIKTTIDVLKFLYTLRNNQEAQQYIQLYQQIERYNYYYYSPTTLEDAIDFTEHAYEIVQPLNSCVLI